jgi:hypothetical protein
VSLERLGVGGHGAAVESGSVIEAVLGISDIASVEECARIGWMGGEIGIEFGLSSLPVGCGDSCFSGGYFGGYGLRSWGDRADGRCW